MKNVDEAVEFDMINNLEQLCEEAKKQKLTYLNLSKKYSQYSEKHKMNLDRARDVDMSKCTKAEKYN